MPEKRDRAHEALRSRLDYGTPEFPFARYVDDLDAGAGDCVQWHWHRQFELSYVEEGTVTCHMGTERVILAAGEGLFLNSGTIHRFETKRRGRLVSFIFAPEFLAEQTSLLYFKYVRPVLGSGVAYFLFREREEPVLPLLRELNENAVRGEVGVELLLHSGLTALWSQVFRRIPAERLDAAAQGSDGAKTRLHSMLSCIHDGYQGRLTLEMIAASANVSKSEALRCFRTGIQTTPIRYLNDYRLSRARERLLSTEEPVSAVSEYAGFESVSYFCQAFKKKYGVSPRTLRRQREGE